jgi:hypothetical protein
MRRFCSILSLAIVTLCLASPLRAQTNEEAFEQFQWQVGTPGARAQAMGGGFMAASEDPTTMLLNPAGLIRISKPQFAVEFRNTDLRVSRLAAVDALLTEIPTTFRDTTNALSFAGVAVPLRANTIVVGFARHEVLDYRSSFHIGPRILPGLPASARAYTPVNSDNDFRASGYAAAISAAIRKDLFVGLTVSADRLRVNTVNDRYDYVAGATRFDLTDSPIITNRSTINDDDSGLGIVVGAAYQPAPTVSLGVVYSKRPDFTVVEDYQLNTSSASGINGPLVSQPGFPAPVTVNTPDQITAGVSWRPYPRTLLTLSAAHITYSELARQLTPVRAHDFVTSADFRVRDVTELHLGGEFNAGSDSRPLFLRAGMFTNPNHRLEFIGDVQPGATITAGQAQRGNAIERSVFNLGPHDDDVRGTFGAGIRLGRHASVDAAYVWKQQFLLSLGGRF